MDFYSTIAGSFQQTLEAVALSVDELAPAIERASQIMVASLLADGKILVCADGVDAALGQLFVCNLLGVFERERPALPALALAGDGAAASATLRHSDSRDIYARPLRALGQAGDVLLCIDSSDRNNADPGLSRALQAARERDIAAVVLSSAAGGEPPAALGPQDVALRIHAPGRARVVEVQTMVLHSFCELIDLSLFGAYDNQET